MKYRDILLQTYQDRVAANPNYSMRSFARDLGMAPSSLSEVLSGKKGISVGRSKHLAAQMRLPAWQIDLFCDLVAQEHAKSPKARLHAINRLKNRKQENKLQILRMNMSQSLTSWSDLAILELTYLKEFKPSPTWIAKKLQLKEADVLQSVTRLREAGLLAVDDATGAWKDVSPLLTSTDGIPSEHIRRFHSSVLQLGLKKLENPDVKARTVKSVVFSLSTANMVHAQNILNDAITRIVSLADQSAQQRETVMCFSAQLFPLLEPTKEST